MLHVELCSQREPHKNLRGPVLDQTKKGLSRPDFCITQWPARCFWEATQAGRKGSSPLLPFPPHSAVLQSLDMEGYIQPLRLITTDRPRVREIIESSFKAIDGNSHHNHQTRVSGLIKVSSTCEKELNR